MDTKAAIALMREIVHLEAALADKRAALERMMAPAKARPMGPRITKMQGVIDVFALDPTRVLTVTEIASMTGAAYDVTYGRIKVLQRRGKIAKVGVARFQLAAPTETP